MGATVMAGATNNKLPAPQINLRCANNRQQHVHCSRDRVQHVLAGSPLGSPFLPLFPLFSWLQTWAPCFLF